MTWDEGRLEKLFGDFQFISAYGTDGFSSVVDLDWEAHGLSGKYATMRIADVVDSHNVPVWVGFGQSRSSIYLEVSEGVQPSEGWELIVDGVYLECVR